MRYLDSEDEFVQRAAVNGLAYVYDEEVGDRLVELLPTRSDVTQLLIVRVLGRVNDASRAEALLAFAKEPTLIPTKVAWIDTMGKLAPNMARPVLQSWATSPREYLVDAARRALAGP